MVTIECPHVLESWGQSDWTVTRLAAYANRCSGLIPALGWHQDRWRRLTDPGDHQLPMLFPPLQGLGKTAPLYIFGDSILNCGRRSDAATLSLPPDQWPMTRIHVQGGAKTSDIMKKVEEALNGEAADHAGTVPPMLAPSPQETGWLLFLTLNELAWDKEGP